MARSRPSAPRQLARRFDAAIFDWDGTAVPDRSADAGPQRECIERLVEHGFDVAVVSGTHVDNVDGQLRARPSGPGRLYLCLNRGSEVFAVGPTGPRLLRRRVATPEEDTALTVGAELLVGELARRGLEAKIVAKRLNRRKIDLIPEPEWADPPKARIGELLAAVEERLQTARLSGLQEVVELAIAASAEAGLADPRVTSDAKHVEIGLTDKSDSSRWLFADLWARGIGPGLVLVGGDEFGSLGGLKGSDSFLLIPEARAATAVSVGVEPGGIPAGVIALGGGPAAFLDLLLAQLRYREELELPRVDEQDGWAMAVEGLAHRRERAHEALLSLADGRLGTSGIPVAAHRSATPGVVLAGAYEGDAPTTQLVQAPIWNLLPSELDAHRPIRRVLDLHTGVQAQALSTTQGPLAAVLFSSLARPGTVALRARGSVRALDGDGLLVAPAGKANIRSRRTRTGQWLAVQSQPSSVVAAMRSELAAAGTEAVVDRFAAYSNGAEPARALRRARTAATHGFDRLLLDHRRAWASRWEDADIVIEGDPDLQLAVRLALFHLMSSASSSDEAAVGARGLSGPGYRGHVFWDADVFVLPFLAATHPASARAMLAYRARRLPAARRAARESGCEGARFPWESAQSGFDVTPRSAIDRRGHVVAIRTGELEEHITADVAWGAGCYADWTGDGVTADGIGRELIVETARYWASRVRIDDEGRGHIDGVIGPDEYHEAVDDNAYTNVMARWNLRRASTLVREGRERRRWLRVADSLVDGYHVRTGLYEQFAGFFALEPLIIADVAPRRPISAVALLGAERVAGAQVVKQTDVLMLHHLVPDEVAAGSLEPNLGYYEPRTAHGSSLSTGIHASLLARSRQLDRALELLRLTSRIDLDDITATTATGLHLAAMGSVWQALVFGFLGARPQGGKLRLDPVLAPGWTALEVRLRFRGRRLRARVERGRVTICADRAMDLQVGSTELRAGPSGATAVLGEEGPNP